jgi:hypothetical protein
MSTLRPELPSIVTARRLQLTEQKMKKLGMAALAALTIAGTIAVGTTGAEARYYGRGGYHGGYHRGGFGIGAGIATGLALGAIGGAYYGGYGPGYYNNGCIRNRVVGYTAYGRPIVRPVNVCY